MLCGGNNELSLSISMALCRELGGEFIVDSVYGKGTILKVFIKNEELKDSKFLKLDFSQEMIRRSSKVYKK